MHSLSVLLVTLIATFARTLVASPSQFWQRLQQRERERQAEQELAPIVLSRNTGAQYYPVWGNGAVLQFDEPSGRAEAPSSQDYVEDDYAYDVAPEIVPVPAYNWGDEQENVASGIEEQAYKDLLMRYLLRELEKQEALPVVRRRSDRNSETEYASTKAPSQAATAEATTTSTTTASTTSTTSTTAKPQVLTFEHGQKEVPLLRPYSENRHRALSWPKELENHQPEQEKRVSSTHLKRVPEIPVFSTSPKKQPKQSLDILTAQLNSLRSRDH